jgi:hypothetical protein
MALNIDYVLYAFKNLGVVVSSRWGKDLKQDIEKAFKAGANGQDIAIAVVKEIFPKRYMVARSRGWDWSSVDYIDIQVAEILSRGGMGGIQEDEYSYH